MLKVDHIEILVGRLNGRLFACNNSCPHRGASLVKGELKGNNNLACWMHGYEYNVFTGNLENMKSWKKEDTWMEQSLSGVDPVTDPIPNNGEWGNHLCLLIRRSDQRSYSSFSITSKTHRRVLILITSFLSPILDKRRSVASPLSEFLLLSITLKVTYFLSKNDFRNHLITILHLVIWQRHCIICFSK